MKIVTIIRKVVKAVIFTVFAIILLAAGLVLTLYSPWTQDMLRQHIAPMLSSAGMKVELESFRLRFPLRVEIGGLSMSDAGGEMVRAGRLEARVEPGPLLLGRAVVPEAVLDRAAFRLGTPDSAMYMVIDADRLDLTDASVALMSMNIDIPAGAISGGKVAMTLNQAADTASTPAPAQPNTMKITLGDLALTDFTFIMKMLPTIDSLGTHIAQGSLHDGLIDMEAQNIKLRRFAGSRLGCAYIAPDSATVANYPVLPESTSASAPWTVAIDSIVFDNSAALYTTRGLEPLPGLDFGYIAVDSLDLGIHDFYNRATTVRLPLQISGTERCGVRLDASGTLDIDSVSLNFANFAVSTPRGTALEFAGKLGSGDLATDPTLPLGLDLQGKIANPDLRDMFPAFLPYLAAMPAGSPVEIRAKAEGTSGELNVDDLAVTVNRCARLRASGTVRNMMDPARLGGNLRLSGGISNVNSFKKLFLTPDMSRQLAIPPTTFAGNVAMNGGNIAGKLTARTLKGKISLDATWKGTPQSYDLDLVADAFPVDAFMPLLGVGSVTAKLDAKGRGLDPFNPATTAQAKLDVAHAVYQKYDYRDITADIELQNGKADITLESTNPDLLVDLHAAGNLDGHAYLWNVSLNGDKIDLQKLGFSPTEANVALKLDLDAAMRPKPLNIAARANLQWLDYETPAAKINIDRVKAYFTSNDSLTSLTMNNRDFNASFTSPTSIDSIMSRFTAVSKVIDTEVAARSIDVESLQKALPTFDLDVAAGRSNFITDILAKDRIGFRHLSLSATNDTAIVATGKLLGFVSGTTRVDTISLDVKQLGPHLGFSVNANSRPGTFDEFAHVRLAGFMARNSLGMLIDQHNIQNKQGYHLGLRAQFSDSTLTARLKPLDPVIGYKPWTVNDDNFISYNFENRHIDANLRMKGDNSSLAIFTRHNEEAAHTDSTHMQEDIILQIADVHIADWIKINPFAPPMTGDLSADLRIGLTDSLRTITGDGNVSLDNFYYDRRRVGDIRADVDVSTSTSGRLTARADLLIDSVKTITVNGSLNDSVTGSPLNLDLRMIRFPLAAANPFLPAGMASLKGTLNGQMDISGTGEAPSFNGWLRFDSTAVNVDMIATSYAFSSEQIPVENSVVRFNNFTIKGVNDNPLTIKGTADLASLSNIGLNLNLNADNMQIVNTRRAVRGADIFGKGFISLNADVKGNFDFMRVDANATIEPGTNITYVMPEAASVIASQANGDMVKFVNFADTAAVVFADSITESSMALMVEAVLNIRTGSTVTVDLSTDGKNKVQIQPEATLDYSMDPFSDGRLTGRININKGFVRYTPPMMSEKLFNFVDNSYVAFTGEMMNPTLNVHAVDVVKANVTQSGKDSRLVNFDVSLDVTGTLSAMKIQFGLSTDDDMTVANELQSMSPDQRANQAMNLLLYNKYVGPSTSTANGANVSGMLYSFLASQLNSWAANTIKGVDISFGIDQYDRTVNGSTSQTTSYSYQVSKSLFDDRFKIVVGGNYSTDANADENFSQNLINDISFEYFLNRAQSMYVRLFRHTGYESILEGEVTQTGVGFVYKRKLATLRNMFRFGRPRRKDTNALPVPADMPALPADESPAQPQEAEPAATQPSNPTEDEKAQH